jgi:hypothetical protein
MKQLKTVEIFDDVKCENCSSYNEGQCCQELPAIRVGPDKKCVKGTWLFEEKIINFRHICFELQPVTFVTNVDDLRCKNCVSYDSPKEECHFHRKNVFKLAPNDWCNNGMWLEDDSSAGSLSSLYPKFD